MIYDQCCKIKKVHTIYEVYTLNLEAQCTSKANDQSQLVISREWFATLISQNERQESHLLLWESCVYQLLRGAFDW